MAVVCGGTAFDLSGRYHIRQQRSGSKSSRRKERILKVDEAHCNNNENDVQTISHNGGDFFSQCAERALYLVFFYVLCSTCLALNYVM